jgi:hypothetical protein
MKTALLLFLAGGITCFADWNVEKSGDIAILKNGTQEKKISSLRLVGDNPIQTFYSADKQTLAVTLISKKTTETYIIKLGGQKPAIFEIPPLSKDFIAGEVGRNDLRGFGSVRIAGWNDNILNLTETGTYFAEDNTIFLYGSNRTYNLETDEIELVNIKFQ